MATLKLVGVSLISTMLFSGCGVNRAIFPKGENQVKVPSAPANSGSLIYFSGVFPSTEEVKIRLDDLKDKPIVWVFASDTCDICLKESKAFRDNLKNKEKPPSKIHLLTTLVGATQRDAIEWKNTNQIPWIVGRDESLSLFKTYCEGTTVPCTLVQMPQLGIVYQHTGEATVGEILNITGPWED